jgi:hypothetical protein
VTAAFCSVIVSPKRTTPDNPNGASGAAVRFASVSGAHVSAGDDTPLAVRTGDHVETVTFDLPDAPTDARVYVGWYTYPDLSRLSVTGDIPGTESNWAQVGALPP